MPAGFKRIGWRALAQLGRQPSLRTYLVFLLLLATVPVVGLMSYQIFQGVQHEEARRAEMLASASSSLANAVEREMNATVDALNTLALSESLRTGNLQLFESSLRSAGPLRQGWRSVFLIDLEGRVVFDTGRTGQAGGRSALAQFPELLLMSVEPEPLISKLVADESPGRYASLVAVPVSVQGRPRYALGAWVSAAFWQALLERDAALAPGVVTTLYDHHRRVVAHTGPAASRLVGGALPLALGADLSAGSARMVLPEGGDGYVGWRRVPVSGWGVGVAMAAEPVDRALQRTVVMAIATAAACLLLGVSLALFAARRVTASLKQLADRGDIDPRLPVGVHEVALLRDALRAARRRDETARVALQNKADEFEALFRSTPVGLAFAHDPDCRRVTHNQAMDALLGPFAEASQSGQVLRDGVVLAGADWPVCLAARQGRSVPAMQLDLVRPGQPARRVIASATPLRDARGRPRGAVAAMVDITEQMQAEARLQHSDTRLRQSERLVELAQEAGAVGFFQYQFETDLLAWTPGQAKLFGAKTPRLESSLGQLLARVDSRDRGDIEKGLHRAFAEHRSSETLDYRVDLPDGAERWLSTRLSIVYSPLGRPEHMVGVTVDVTDRKRAEHAQQALIEHEQVEREKAEAANRAKDQLLAMLGHELRNPLSAISFAVGVLNRDPSAQMSASACEIIERQTHHLSRLIAEMLSMTSAVSGQAPLARQTLNLAVLVERVFSRLQQDGEAAGHRVALALADAWVEADPDHIEQVVRQLVGNALKYTPAGSEVSVVVRPDDGQALLQVRDNGPGIDPDLLPRVFDLFVQGERPLDRQAGGLGLGLTLVKRLVEKHGGTVVAHSEATGSLFEVRFAAVPEPGEAHAAWARSARAHHRVLLIEDNPDALSALSDLLSLDGHQVSSATDGESGLKALLDERPDIAIVDIGLPRLDGFQLAKQARAGGYAGRMVALTGYGQEADVKRSLKAGFDAHLVKPLQPGQLREQISQA